MKSKKKKKKKILSSFCNFSLLPFPIFLLFFPPSIFSLPLFPGRSAEISWSEVSGGHSAPAPLPPSVTPLLSRLQLRNLCKITALSWKTRMEGQLKAYWGSGECLKTATIKHVLEKLIKNLWRCFCFTIRPKILFGGLTNTNFENWSCKKDNIWKSSKQSIVFLQTSISSWKHWVIISLIKLGEI